MVIRRFILTLSLLMLGVGVLTLPARAQSAGQSIIFSTPLTEAGQPDKSPPGALNSQAEHPPGTLPAPVQLYDFNPPADRLPPPVSTSISPQQQRMQRLLRDRKNWIFMTPEEILGAATAEKMLQPPEQDALGSEKNPTQLERYLLRESRLRDGVTNNPANDRARSAWNPGNDADSLNPNRPDDRRYRTVEAARNLNQLLNGQPVHADVANSMDVSGWESFSHPQLQALPKPDRAQLAAMDRFRQLLNPGSDYEAQSPTAGSFVSAAKSTVDPLFAQPDFLPNPAGASYTPLSSGIARPTGLTPLPDAVTSLLPSVEAPSWKPQPAPWLLQGPQPFVTPQRKGF